MSISCEAKAWQNGEVISTPETNNGRIVVANSDLNEHSIMIAFFPENSSFCSFEISLDKTKGKKLLQELEQLLEDG